MLVSVIYSTTGPGQTSAPKPGVYNSIDVTHTKKRCVKVPLLDVGYIKQMVIKQTGGTAKAAVVDLYCSSIPFAEGEYAVATAGSGVPDLYKIMPSQAVVSGTTLDITPDYEVGWPFRNVDGDYTNNQRYVYLVINPTSSVDLTTWDVLILASVTEADA